MVLRECRGATLVSRSLIFQLHLPLTPAGQQGHGDLVYSTSGLAERARPATALEKYRMVRGSSVAYPLTLEWCVLYRSGRRASGPHPLQ